MKTINIFFLLTMLVILNGHCQIPPSFDNTWTMVSGLSDEFSGATIGSNWCILSNCTGTGSCSCYNWGGNSKFLAANTTLSDGLLIFKADAPTGDPPYSFSECCKTGGVQSKYESYTYGYFEIYAQLPGVVDQNGIGYSKKFWPALWTYHEEFNGNICTVHDEIDILDPGGAYYSDARSFHGQIADENGSGGMSVPYTYYHQSSDPLCEDFHKYSAEWLPDRILFYFDDVLVGQFYNDQSIVMDPMRLVFDLQIDSGVKEFDLAMVFPQYMKIDYFRYYQLKYNCGNLVLNTQLDFGHYLSGPKVYSNITIGNGSTSFSLSPGTTKTFRASNEVIINGDFTVPLSAELNIIPTVCQ